MKARHLALFAALALLPCHLLAQRITGNFDAGWKFFAGDPVGAAAGAFADAGWQKLDVPHDWSIAGPFAPTNLTGGAGAFLPGGVVWYRKHFSLPAGEPGRRVFVEFDGVMQNSDVWINGVLLGHRPNGYVGFQYELTGQVYFGRENILAVRCDTSAQPASRWYSGGGIYRHVRLVETTPIFVPANGLFVATPHVAVGQATVRMHVLVTNTCAAPQSVFLHLSVLDPAGQTVVTAPTPPQTISNFCASAFQQDLVIPRPRLWNLDRPALYQARVEVCGSPLETAAAPPGKVASPAPWGGRFDNLTVSFGIRDAHFEPDTGFWLNGKNFKLNGVCLHHDGGAFGAAVPLEVWRQRLVALRQLGVNAIRTAHNPPAPEFLDACDQLGFLVMDEFFDCWTVAKNPYDYHLYFNDWSATDERDTIWRDRNHPSVILYSVGNEIHDTPQADKAKRILSGLVAVAHAADPTRPVTQALFRPNVSHDYDDGLADLLDVVGQNYRENEILAAHAQKPSRKIVGTENTHDRKQWVAVRDHAPYAGQFLWTGIDYLGESRRWPVIGHGSGLLDRTGAIRPLGRERQSWWSPVPMVALARRIAGTELMPTDPGYGAEERHTQVLFADWTPRDLSLHEENVEVYSNAKSVELFLNDQSLGIREINADAAPRNWRVPFAPGILRAVARADHGEPVATNELRTAGPPAKIILSADLPRLTPGWDGVALVRAQIVDAQGIPVPRAQDLVSFAISGPGTIAAVDNADNASQESFQGHARHAYQGACVVFLKATATSGKITVRATAAGLASDSCSLKIVP